MADPSTPPTTAPAGRAPDPSPGPASRPTTHEAPAPTTRPDGRPVLPLTPHDRVVLACHGLWDNMSRSKTAIQVLRFSPAQVTAIIDPDNADPGEDACARYGIQNRPPVPVVASWADARGAHDEAPTHAIVGVAPPGGALPPAMHADLRAAAEAGVSLVGGLHEFLADDPTLAASARAHDAAIIDLRRPPSDHVVLSGAGRQIDVPVITTIGTDCSSGKMTIAVALARAATEHGLRVGLVATGQTGLLLGADAGAPIDRCIADFAAGEMERQTLHAAGRAADGAPQADAPDLVIVEGQGAITHPAYSGVTAAILHGSYPDALVLCHVEDRPRLSIGTIGPGWRVPTPAEGKAAAEAFLRGHTDAQVAAAALVTPELERDAYLARVRQREAELGVPATDALRDGPDPLLGAVLRHLVTTGRDKGRTRIRDLARRLT